MKLIYQAQPLPCAHQDDIDLFLQAPALRCLSDPHGETQVWLADSHNTVFKVFDIRRRRQQWQARRNRDCKQYGKRYGRAELANAQRVQALGIPAPAPVAYLERRNALFCSRQVVAYPYLREHQTLQEAIAASDEPLALLDRVEALVHTLAVQGVFHLDLNSRNLMVAAHGEVQLIDFEYMAWERAQRGCLYTYYLGYLWQKWLHQHLEQTLYGQWFEQVLRRRQGDFADSEMEMRRWFATGQTEELSRSQRYRIFL